jgi:hypothetical protein
MCGMEVCKLYEKYFPVNTITTMEILIQTYLNLREINFKKTCIQGQAIGSS